MNRSPVIRTLFLCLILLMGISAVHSQGENLLANPGFENPFVAVEDGGASMVAEGWTPWALEFDQYVMPEYYLASDTVNGMTPPRILSGEDAQQYFTFFAPHIAGVYQQVSGVQAGDALTFGVNAYVWSSSGDNSDVSDGNGELVVQVGIDPNGGTDAASEAIVWSDPVNGYDRYQLYSVSAVAAGEAVTVFVRSTVGQVAMNNVVYLDDASLTVTGTGVVVEATEAATAEASPEVSVTEAVTEVATEVVIEVTDASVVTDEPTEAATEVATEVVVVPPPTEEATEAPVTPEVTEVATEEATEAPTAVPTEVLPTEVPPTAAPTEVIPTEVPTEVQPTEVPTDVLPTETPQPSPTLDTAAFPFTIPYTVVRGDTVGALATRFGSTIEAIIIANQLPADARIFVTQQLLIPVPVLPTPTLIPSETPFPTFTLPPTETPFPTFTLSPTVPPLPTEVPVQVLPADQQAAQPNPPIAQTYVVQYGDSLSSIARRFGVGARELAQVNHIVNPNLILVGQILQIPVAGAPTPVPSTTPAPSSTPIPPTATLVNPQVYQVQPGDNLYRISIRFNVPIRTLIEINGILDASRIFVGQLLIIPSA